MLLDADVALALETLGAIPGFPRDAGAKAAIERALRKNFQDGLDLIRAADAAVGRMQKWSGVPGVLQASEVETVQEYVPDWRNQPQPEPPGPEELAEIAALAKRLGMPLHGTPQVERPGNLKRVRDYLEGV